MKKIFAIIVTLLMITSSFCVSASDLPVSTDDVIRLYGLQKDGTPVFLNGYTEFDKGWEAAVDYAEDHNYMTTNSYERIVVDLLADWKANEKGEFGESWKFASDWGDGFQYSTIYIPSNTRMMINMNGHTIDRALGDRNELDGEVICIDEKADVIINGGKNGDEIARADDEDTTVQFGTIKGGNSDNGAGGIHIQDKANVTLNNVNITANIADDDNGAGIALHGGATLVMNGGGFIDNINNSIGKDAYGAGIYVDDSTARFDNVLFSNNQFTRHTGNGAALYSANSSITMDGCMVVGNGLWDEEENFVGAHYTLGGDGDFKIKNTTFIGNGAIKDNVSQHDEWEQLSVIYAGYSNMLFENCTFTSNTAKNYVIDAENNENHGISVINSTFTDNQSPVWHGNKGTFTSCTFEANNKAGYKYEFYRYTSRSVSDKVELIFIDCSMGESKFEESGWFAKFIDTDSKNGAKSSGSLFGEGSLTIIVAYVALIVSIASLIVNVTSKKNKTILATSNNTETDTKE